VLTSKLDAEVIGRIDAACDRLDAVNPSVHAFLPEENRRRRLLGDAAAVAAHERLPLKYDFVGIKDLFNVSGLPTRAGSRLPEECFAGPEATAVTRLKQAGALILGKAVSTEFAYFSPGETENPRYPGHTPGGSSSGSAAAVAAGLCPYALGTQTIGSVIRPAAFCGVFGFKPSSGRVPMDGVFPFSQTMDTVGWFASGLEGIRQLAPVLAEGWDASVSSTSTLKLAIPADEYLAQAEPDILSHFHALVRRLRDGGLEIVKTGYLQEIEAINGWHRAIIAYEFHRNHRELFRTYGHLYSVHSTALYQEGAGIGESSYRSALRQMGAYRSEADGYMCREGIAAWLSPSAPSFPLAGLAVTGSPIMSLPWTFLGQPSLAVPCGEAENGLPLSLQIVSGPGRDELLLGAVAPAILRLLG
jgi:Asp-tRNA(Asn)/Glu-tRNA(Gln) amidotransferase A subunit family amidase